MNYLAHLHLGGPAPQQLLGSLYGDFVKGSLEGRFPPALEAAIVPLLPRERQSTASR